VKIRRARIQSVRRMCVTTPGRQIRPAEIRDAELP
jgi:hypothetical protein